MRRLLLCGVFMGASAAFAQTTLTEPQAQAAAVLKPMLAEQIPAEHLDNLVNCMVTVAKGREVRRIGGMDPAAPDAKTVAVVNDLIARPKVHSCLSKALNKS